MKRLFPWSSAGVFIVILLGAGIPRLYAQCGVTWTVTYDLSAERDVAINQKRLFHGPAAAVAPNGDWLVAYQDSIDHRGDDGVISQMRSTDQGKTWKSDGIVFDQRKLNYFGRNPAYGVTPNGLIVLVVQRWRPLAPMVKYQTGKTEGIRGSVYLISRDNGKTYEYRGLVDPVKPLRHQGSTGPIRTYDGKLYMIAVSQNASPGGATLYTSDNILKGWHFDGWVFRFDQMPYSKVNYSYPSLIRRPDGALVAQMVSFGRHSKNYQRVSRDMGKTWSAPRELKGLKIGWNPDLDYAGKVMVAHGRGQDAASYVLYFSPDNGQTWGCPVVLDRYGFRGGGGYGASLRTKQGNLFVVFSTDDDVPAGKNGGKPNVRGVLLSNVHVRRP